MIFKELYNRIKKIKSPIVIATHKKPDGDAIGTQTALALALSADGKDVFLFNSDTLPASFNFLEACRKKLYFKKNILEKSEYSVILVDCSSLKRSELDKEIDLSKNMPKEIICIDHHKSEEKTDETLYFIDENASCTGEILYSAFKNAGVHISKEIAESIYTAIISDTRSFKYSRTTALCHQITSELIDKKLIDNERINANVFSNSTEKQLRLTGWVLSNFTTMDEGQIVITEISHKIIKKFKIDQDDIKGITNNLLMLEKTEFAILVMYNNDDNILVIIKSKGNFNLNAIMNNKSFSGKIKKFGAEINIKSKSHLNSLLNAIKVILE